MTDQSDRQDLEDRVDQLESTISKMLPSRRDALKLGGAALVGGAAMSGTASAGTQQAGTIGTAGSPVDIESEDITNADTISSDKVNAQDIDAVSVNTGLITKENSRLQQERITVPGNSADELLPSLATDDKVGLLMIRLNNKNVGLFILTGTRGSTSELHDDAAVFGASSGADSINVFFDGSVYVIENTKATSRTLDMWLIS